MKIQAPSTYFSPTISQFLPQNQPLLTAFCLCALPEGFYMYPRIYAQARIPSLCFNLFMFFLKKQIIIQYAFFTARHLFCLTVYLGDDEVEGFNTLKYLETTLELDSVTI